MLEYNIHIFSTHNSFYGYVNNNIGASQCENESLESADFS